MAGTVVKLRPDPLPFHPIGRLIHCPGCGHAVDVIEINLGGTFAMYPDVCGTCQVAGADPEPRTGSAA